MLNVAFMSWTKHRSHCSTLCSRRGALLSVEWLSTAAQQKESTYAACRNEKLLGGKQVIWEPKSKIKLAFCQYVRSSCNLLYIFYCHYIASTVTPHSGFTHNRCSSIPLFNWSANTFILFRKHDLTNTCQFSVFLVLSRFVWSDVMHNWNSGPSQLISFTCPLYWE